MHEVTRTETFRPPGLPEVVVELLGAQCTHCGKKTVLPSQMDENLRRRTARKLHYGQYLLGEEIFAFRRKYGLTQQAASRIFGKGIIAFSRYESEKSFPDESTTKLIKIAIRNSGVLKELADEAGVDIPLWDARCADERAQKVKVLRHLPMKQVVYASPVSGSDSTGGEFFQNFDAAEMREAVA
jgi:HTH-type transcriptional regulator/antitoxin MqsA